MPQPHPLHADNDQVNIRHIILLTARLAQLLEEENELLSGMQISALTPLQEHKRLIVEALEFEHRKLNTQPDALTATGETEKSDLRDVMNAFEIASKRNVTRLSAAREANREISEIIQRHITRQQTPETYGQNGIMLDPCILPQTDQAALTVCEEA